MLSLAHAWLFPLGVLASCFGTIVGAGGSVIAVPVMLLAFPGWNVASITTTGLILVVTNATLATVSFARQQRVHFAGGVRFAAAAVPSGILGVWASLHVALRPFSILFGALLVAVGGLTAARVMRGGWTDRQTIPEPNARGIAASGVLGFLANLFGFGGGSLHVPVLIEWIGYPTRIATATSQLVLASTAAVGLLVHVLVFHSPFRLSEAILLSSGALVGSPIGAWLSVRLRSRTVLLMLSGAIASLGIRLVMRNL